MHIKASRRRDEDEEKESKGAAQWVSFHSGGNLSKSTERRLRRQHLSFIRKIRISTCGTQSTTTILRFSNWVRLGSGWSPSQLILNWETQTMPERDNKRDAFYVILWKCSWDLFVSCDCCCPKRCDMFWTSVTPKSRILAVGPLGFFLL